MRVVISGHGHETHYFRAHRGVFHPFVVGAKKQMFADFLDALYIASVNVLE